LSSICFLDESWSVVSFVRNPTGDYNAIMKVILTLSFNTRLEVEAQAVEQQGLQLLLIED